MEKKERKNKESINNHQFNWFFEKENKKKWYLKELLAEIKIALRNKQINHLIQEQERKKDKDGKYTEQEI